MVDRFQGAALKTPLKIPLLYGIDSVHGDGNLLGATVFPHNIGLGATRDPDLVRRVAKITAEETRATGPQWTFSPCICAARDDRWGRTYEAFSEDPRLVEKFETAIDGYQEGGVLATAKHYAGDGDTVYGTGNGDYTIDQGITVTNHKDFWKDALRQYVPAVQKHHVNTVMPSYSSVDWTEDGVGNPLNMHAHRELITDVLKGKLGFNGFVISDYNGIDHIGPDWRTNIKLGVLAGIDMFMEPDEDVPGLPDHADGPRGQEGDPDEPDRRRGAPDPAPEVRARPLRAPLHRPPQARPDRLRAAPQGRAQGRRRVAGAARRTSTARCRCASATTSTSPAATPTASATRPVAGRSRGRATRTTRSPATRSSTASSPRRAAT